MSFKAAAWAIEQSVTKTAVQKLVLIALADAHNGQTGRCDPSIQRVADICHMSYRTVTRTLAELEQMGLIVRKNRRDQNKLKTSNSYDLRMGQYDLSMGHGDLSDRTNTTLSDGSLCPINQGLFNQEKNQEYPPTPQGGLAFEEFWTRYPKRVGKGAAQKAWNKLSLENQKATVSDLSTRPANDQQWIRDGGKYIPHPATYLNQQRWADDWQTVDPISELTRHNASAMQEFLNGTH